MSLVNIYGKGIVDRGESECKGRKTGEDLKGLGSREEEALVTRAEGGREEEVVEDEVEEMGCAEWMEGRFHTCCKDWFLL